MANPFLFEEPEQLSSTSSGFNPFLSSSEFGHESVQENPFLSSYQVDDNVFNSGSTNPFAFGDDANNEQSLYEGENQDLCYTNIFESSVTATVSEQIFQNYEEPINDLDSGQNLFFTDDVFDQTNQNQDAQDLMNEINETFGNSKEGQPPRRPPPPRPMPPKETTDLIKTVTGTMEATSSHLLDRLQATRTPSPTPMRDLQSPSPTQFGDLLGVDEPFGISDHTISQEFQPSSEINLLDDFDFTESASQSVTVKEPDNILQTVNELSSGTTISPSNSVSPITVISPVVPVQAAAVPSPVLSTPSPVVNVLPTRPAPPERPKLPSRPPPPVPPPPNIQQEQRITQEVNKDEGIADMFIAESNDDFNTNTQPKPTFSDIFNANTQIDPENISDNNKDIGFSEDISSFNGHDVKDEGSRASVFISEKITPPKAEADFADIFNRIDDITDVSSNALPDIYASQSNQELTETTQPFNAAFEISSGVESAFQDLDQSNFNSTITNESDFGIFDNISTQKPSVVPVEDAFDAFAAKFDSTPFSDMNKSSDPFDPFGGTGKNVSDEMNVGFGADDSFDAFLALREPPPVPQGTPARALSRGASGDSENGNEFNVFIKPKTGNDANLFDTSITPIALPPPKSPVQSATAFQDSSPRFNPFDNQQEISGNFTDNIFAQATEQHQGIERTDSQETPPTPLFDEDVSQPLEDFPRIYFEGSGWEMQLRQPNKKKITGQRFWKKIFVRLVQQGENPVLQLFNGKDDKDPFQELPLQPCYSVSEIAAQQFDQYGKIFTIKLQFIFYKERPGVRPGQVTKAERLTNKLSQFAAYAIQGDYHGCKEFGSDLKKLGLPVEHAPQVSQLFKLGSFSFEDMKQFSVTVEESLFKLSAHRDRALTYKMEEVQITVVDELYVEQNATNCVLKQIARVRLFFLGFLSGMPDVELGINDLVRQGKEVVGRHDIIPVVTEEWIRLESVEFHSCVQLDEYDRTRTIKFKPPDACYLELMRFRVRPPRNRELPLQLKATMLVSGNKVTLNGDILVPGFTSRKLGQIPCEDIVVRFPIPECWIYLFRVEKHFRYGSVKSAHRRTGKVKGLERFLGAVENVEPSLMEVTSGQAKYEHQHRSIVWRIPRLPKEGQGAYTTHNFICRMQLTSFDQIPDELAKYAYVEFTMPATTVSHTTVRSVSICNSDSDEPPEKYVRQLSRHEYRVEIDHTQAEGPADYIVATAAKPPPPPPPTIKEEPAKVPVPADDSDSDSSG